MARICLGSTVVCCVRDKDARRLVRGDEIVVPDRRQSTAPGQHDVEIRLVVLKKRISLIEDFMGQIEVMCTSETE